MGGYESEFCYTLKELVKEVASKWYIAAGQCKV